MSLFITSLAANASLSLPPPKTSHSNRIFRIIDTRNLTLLKKHLDIHPEDLKQLAPGRITPLHYLAGAGPKTIRLPVLQEPPQGFVQTLIARGASVDEKAYFQRTALDFAAMVGYAGIAQELLKHKAKADDHTLYKALSRTVHFDPCFQTERALLASGIDLTKSNKSGAEILHRLIETISSYLERAEKFSMDPLDSDLARIADEHFNVLDQKVKFLLEQGVDPDVAVEGKTALQRCFEGLDPTWTGRIQDRALRQIIPVLFEKTKNKQIYDEHGWSLLHWAMYGEMTELARELISQGFDLDERAAGRNPAPSGAGQGQLSFQSQSLPRQEAPHLQGGVLHQSNLGVTPRELASLNMNSLFFHDQRMPKTPKDLVKIIEKLPSYLKPSLEYWKYQPNPTKKSADRIFTTGLADPVSSTPLIDAVHLLYRINEGKTLMGKAIASKDLSSAMSLIQGGWNILIEKDFINNALLNERDCGQLSFQSPILTRQEAPHLQGGVSHHKSVIGFDKAFREIKDQTFALALLKELNASKESGVTLASELQSACDRRDEAKILLLLKTDLTPKQSKASSNFDFKTWLEDWYFGRLDDGWSEVPFSSSACRVVEAALAKGWIKSDDRFRAARSKEVHTWVWALHPPS